MANSKGQAMAHGHSAGAQGHGGHHKKDMLHGSGVVSHKSDHMRSMIGRSNDTMLGGMGQSGGPGMIGDSGMGAPSGMPM